MKWKKCISGTYDFCDKNDNIIFQILNIEEETFGQVFKANENHRYSELVFETTINSILDQCLVIAKKLGWEIDYEEFYFPKDFSKLEEYKSKVYSEYKMTF